MAWTTPKTDWEPTDPITYQDFNRIKNNLVYLNDIFNEQYGQYNFNPGADMGADQLFDNASVWNMFEDCVEHFQRSGVIITHGERSYYTDNGRMPNYIQLNRLEQCTYDYANLEVAVTGVTVSPTTLSMKPSETKQLTVTVLPNNATNKNITITKTGDIHLTYSYNSQTGVITLTTYSDSADGTVTITVTTEDGGYQASCTVTVAAIHVQSITLSKSSLYMNKGTTETLVATVLPANADNKNVSWSSSDTSIATVSSSGVVTSLNSTGSCVITATTEDGGLTATCTVNVIVVSTGTYISSGQPFDLILIQKNRKNGYVVSEKETAILLSKYAILNGGQTRGQFYKDSNFAAQVTSFYNNNFSDALKGLVSSFTGGVVFSTAYTIANNKVNSWTNNTPYNFMAAEMFDLGILNENDIEYDLDIPPVEYIQQHPEVRRATTTSGNYTAYYLSTQAIVSGYIQLYWINQNGEVVTPPASQTSAAGYIRPVLALDPETKVYPTPMQDGAYVIDFGSLPGSIAIKDLPLGSIIRDVPYEG